MLRPEPPHVAQQSRREKLRVPPPASPSAAAHQNFYESPFPPPLDFTSGGAGCSDSGSAHFFNQFDGGGGGVWRSSDWVLNAPFLAATSQLGELHFPSLPYSPYPLHEVVSSSSSSSMVNQALEMSSLVAPLMPSMDGASEMLLLPSYGGNAASVWTNRVAENWSGKGDAGFGATIAGETTQGLSLSLSSNPPRVAQMEERFAQRFAGGAVQGIAGGGRPAAGPLGPFTGYATILKSSKFLKPAQQLLDEFCCAVTGSRAAKQHDLAGKRLVSGSGDELCGAWAERNSVASSSSMHSSTDAGGEGSAGVRPGEIHRPEFEHKKAKLLYMQEEVCRRYKHYHQQMQLVVSSFESVAGLSSATPYASLTLKAVSKQFRCLKNAISDQLRHVGKVLGDELVGSSTSSCKNDNLTVPKLKYVEPSFRRQKPLDGAIGYSDSHPIWRPQRGLPERAVSVLRAWLFDHFLHPYPTDTDKHMLATQTGLSRNQVSNWFINARVRLWKPMVEEIHMLETRGMAGMDLNSCRNSEKIDAGQGSEVATNRQMEYATAVPMTTEGSHCMEQWHQEKKSRLEDCSAMDGGGGLMSFAYQGGMDIGGLGAVSLTLGLRQGEGSQQHQIRHYGHQILHDFVG